MSGPAPLASDTLNAADESMVTLTIVTIVVIIAMLLIAYRSITRAIIPLFGVLITLATARGVVSLLVENHVIGISSFAMNMAVSLVLGVATDYGIFYLGRFQEARRAGEDRESAYYTSVRSVAHVVLGSGIAISGACLCLSLTTLDYFRTLGPPCFVAMVVAVIAALTLGPALLILQQGALAVGAGQDQSGLAQVGYGYRQVAGGDDRGCGPGDSVVYRKSGQLHGEL